MNVTMVVNSYEGNELLVPPHHNFPTNQISVYKEYHLCQTHIDLVNTQPDLNTNVS